MGIKLTGAEWKTFMDDEAVWSDHYMDDDVIIMDGITYGDDRTHNLPEVAPTARIEVVSGVICCEEPPYEYQDLVSAIRRWKKAQTTISFVVEIHKDKADAVKSAVKAAGGKVVA
jgi:hypothetical protein